MTIRWVFKSGYYFDMICDEFTSTSSKLSSTGMITGYEATGITKNKPIGIDFTELAAVYRLFNDEGNISGESEQEG